MTPNEAVHVTAARLRFRINVKGSVWAAARDGWRYAVSDLWESRLAGRR